MGTKVKKESVSKLKKKADALFSHYVRLRDADRYGVGECITCGVRKPWQELQAGHFIKRSVSLLRYDDENVNSQCYQCNVLKYGEQYRYAKELDLKYGDGTADRLHAQRNTTHKFTIVELKGLIEEAKKNIAWLELSKS